MITNKLKIIFGISILAFILHGIEEINTHFYDLDTHDLKIFKAFSGLSTHGATFTMFQIMFWLLLIIVFFMLMGERWRFNILAIAGLVYILELHHIYKAIVVGGYYPGLYSAFLFPIIAIFFWREWWINRKRM